MTCGMPTSNMASTLRTGTETGSLEPSPWKGTVFGGERIALRGDRLSECISARGHGSMVYRDQRTTSLLDEIL